MHNHVARAPAGNSGFDSNLKPKTEENPCLTITPVPSLVPHKDARLDFSDLYAFGTEACGDAGKSILIMDVHPNPLA